MMDPTSWLWLIAAIVLVLAELATGTFVFLFFAAAAAAAWLCSLIGLGLSVQASVFLVGVVVGGAATPKLVKRLQRKGSSDRFGVDALVDQTAIVTEAIDPVHGRGMVKVGGELWRARAATELAVGEVVRVGQVDGTKLVVFPVVQPSAASRLGAVQESERTIEINREDDG